MSAERSEVEMKLELEILTKNGEPDLPRAADDLASFVATQAIGVLHAIQMGWITPDAGIWTLGRPRFWRPLAGRSPALDAIVEVLQQSDELSGLPSEALDRSLSTLLEQLRAALCTLPDPGSCVTWDLK